MNNQIKDPKFKVGDKVKVLVCGQFISAFRSGTIGTVKVIGDHIGGFDYDVEVQGYFKDKSSLCQWYSESELELVTN